MRAAGRLRAASCRRAAGAEGDKMTRVGAERLSGMTGSAPVKERGERPATAGWSARRPARGSWAAEVVVARGGQMACGASTHAGMAVAG